MSLAELYYRGRIEEATSFSEVDGIVSEAEDEGWRGYTSIHVAAESRKRDLMDDFWADA